MIQFEQFSGDARRAFDAAKERLTPIWLLVKSEARKSIDLDRWRSASTVKERLEALSWPRVGATAGGVAVLAGAIIFLVLPRGPQAYAPPLPTELQLEAKESAMKAAKAELSPSLARANQTVSSEPSS